jgi:hypothetical protein
MVRSRDRFRDASAKCLEEAERAADPRVRATLVASALKWLELAEEGYGHRRFDLGLDDGWRG